MLLINWMIFIFVKEDIIYVLDELSPSSSAGPDGVPAILLKRCKRSLAEPHRNTLQIIPPNRQHSDLIKARDRGARLPGTHQLPFHLAGTSQ